MAYIAAGFPQHAWVVVFRNQRYVTLYAGTVVALEIPGRLEDSRFGSDVFGFCTNWMVWMEFGVKLFYQESEARQRCEALNNPEGDEEDE